MYKENAIILCVVPANQDFVTNESVKVSEFKLFTRNVCVSKHVCIYENAIILCVVPANQDFVTNESVKVS